MKFVYKQCLLIWASRQTPQRVESVDVGTAEASAFFSVPPGCSKFVSQERKAKENPKRNSAFYIIRIRQFANCAGKAHLTCVGKIFTGSCRKTRRHNKSQTGEKTEEEAAVKRGPTNWRCLSTAGGPGRIKLGVWKRGTNKANDRNSQKSS